MALFSRAKLIKTKKLTGHSTLVGYVNGQVIVALQNGMTIMNEDLEIIKEIGEIQLEKQSLMISGNDNYVALCDMGGVYYYRPNGTTKPKVS